MTVYWPQYSLGSALTARTIYYILECQMNENLLKNLGCIFVKQSPLGPPLGTPLTMIPPRLFHRLSQDQRQNKPYTDHILKSLRLFVSNDPLILRTVPSLVRFKADVQLQFIDCFSVSGKLQYLKSFHCWAKLVKTVILTYVKLDDTVCSSIVFVFAFVFAILYNRNTFA